MIQVTDYRSRDRRLRDFEGAGNSSDIWLITVDSLLNAAAVLRAKRGEQLPDDETKILQWFRLHTVVQMLRGMAIECFLKAVWLKRGGTLVDNGEYKGIQGAADHDLLSLFDAVSPKTPLCFTDQEREILKRLSYAITSGRYPIGKSVDGPKRFALSSDPFWGLWRTSDEALFDSIVNKLYRVFSE
jgi:hypothetical protein